MAPGFKPKEQGPVTESPLARKPAPRRLAGQSLAEGRRLDLFEQAVPWLTLPAFCWAMFVVELLRWLWSAPPSPTSMAIVAVLGTALSAYRLRPIFRDLKNVGQGIRGERYVGQVLEDLFRPRGYRVLHDIPSDTSGFNVDHVLVGPEGVYAVETKHYSRPTKGARAIVYDGQSLTIPGVTPDRDPLAQTRAAAKHVREVLRRTTGRDVPVRPVLVFAGWFVEQRCRRPDVWVVNENHLPAYIDQEDEHLSPEDVALYADRLAREGADKD